MAVKFDEYVIREVLMSDNQENQSKVQSKTIVFSLGVFFSFAMHLFVPNQGGVGLALPFNAFSSLALIMTICIGAIFLVRRNLITYNNVTVGLFISCVLISAPIFYENSVGFNAFYRLVGLWLGFLLFFILQQFLNEDKYINKVLVLIVISSYIELLISYSQLFLRLKYVDFSSVVPTGIFQQPNVMASYLATSFAISMYLMAENKGKYIRFLLYAFPFFSLPILIVLSSRTGWLSLVLVLLTLTPYFISKQSKKSIFIWASSFFLGILSGIYIASIDQSLAERVEFKANTESDVRLNLYKQSFDMFLDKPIVGYGLGRYNSEYILFTAQKHFEEPTYPVGMENMTHPHNELLYLAVEGGMIPIFGVALAIIIILNCLTRKGLVISLSIFGLLIPILVHSQLEYPFYHSFPHWVTFIILVFVASRNEGVCKRLYLNNATKLILSLSAVVALSVSLFYIPKSIHTKYLIDKYVGSERRNISDLRNIDASFFWKEEYNIQLYTSVLGRGLAKGDKELLKQYITWASSQAKKTPRSTLYKSLIISYQALGDYKKAEAIRNLSQQLFPDKNFSNVNYQAYLK